MKYPLTKYRFYQFTDKETGMTHIVATSTYGGKTVKATAKCDPRDEFDAEKGRVLAATRCNFKIAERRKKRAANKYIEAVKKFNDAKAHLADMRQYYMDADDQVDEAAAELRELLKDY